MKVYNLELHGRSCYTHILLFLVSGSKGFKDKHLHFVKCEKRQCVNVSILDDEEVEYLEIWDVTLKRTPDMDSRIKLDQVNGKIQISDNDGR